jgi:hypothetical protein
MMPAKRAEHALAGIPQTHKHRRKVLFQINLRSGSDPGDAGSSFSRISSGRVREEAGGSSGGQPFVSKKVISWSFFEALKVIILVVAR